MKNIIKLSFIFSLLLMLTPVQSDAQFGNVLKKAKKKAKKILKENTSTSKEKPDSDTTNKDEDIAVIGSEKDEENKDWIFNKRNTNYGKRELPEDFGDETLRNEANRLSSDVFSVYNSHGIRNLLTTEVAYEINENHRPYFIEKNYHPQAFERLNLRNVNKDWSENEDEILNELYNLTDVHYTESLEHSRDHKYYNEEKNRMTLEGAAVTMRKIADYLFPENSKVDALAVYMRKRADQLNAVMEEDLDEVSINSVHKANLNKLLFTNNKNINPETAPASAYKTDFVPGEEIYAVAMLDKGINNQLLKTFRPEYSFAFNGDRLTSKYMVEHTMFPVKDNQQYFVFPVVVKAVNFKCSDIVSPQIERGLDELSAFGPRTHTVKVELHDWDELHSRSGDITGTITIDGAQGDMTVYKQMGNSIRDKCPR